jgi:type IV pilus assembly protein PilW
MSKSIARRQAGMTLVEVMVSITVGLILLSGVVSIFVSNKTAYRLQESTNVLDENARYALNQIQYHLRMGDHWGGVEADFIDVDADLAALPIATTCSQSPVISSVGFFALEGGASSPLSCIPAADYVPNTDVLVVRYADPERTVTASLIATDVYLRAKVGAAGILFRGDQDMTDLPGDLYEVPEPETQANYAYRTVIYFIRKCASQDRGTAGVCDAADDTTPTLARLVLNGTSLVQEDVVAGVEQLQATFGVLTDGAIPTTQYFSATTITTNNQWPSVVNVQVSLIVRGPERDVAYTDDRDFAMYGGFTYDPPTADEQFHRKQFNFAVQVRNKTRG